MARVRIMYWKEIPVQVKADDESGEASAQLDDRFQQELISSRCSTRATGLTNT